MKGILRLALGYFSFVPLQRGLLVIGAALMLVGALCALPGTSIYTRHLGLLPLLLGAAFIVLTPAFFGGAVLRYASTRAVLQQRPHGRLRMLLAATVAVTLVAVVVTLPALLTRPPANLRIHAELWRIAPLNLFAVSWSSVALIWIGMFICSGGRLWPLLVWLALIATANFGKYLPDIPVPGTPTLLVFTIAAWLAFGRWYMTAQAIRPSMWYYSPATQRAFANTNVGKLLSRIDSRPDDVSRGPATQQYLFGGYSLSGYAVTWTLMVLGFLLLRLILRGVYAGVPGVPPVIPPEIS